MASARSNGPHIGILLRRAMIREVGGSRSTSNRGRRVSWLAARGEHAQASVLFAGKAAVVGMGLDRIDDGYGVKVNLETPPAPDAGLPETIDGVPVRNEVVGTIRPR